MALPGQPDVPVPLPGRGTGTCRQRGHRCRDGAGCPAPRSALPASTMRPGYITATSWARYSTTAKLWVMKR